MSTILLLNCGSSSIKYQVIEIENENVLAVGLVEKIGLEDGIVTHEVAGQKIKENHEFTDHSVALQVVTGLFEKYGPSLDEVVAVGHRTVHGGDKFKATTVIDDELLETLKELSPLAPLHNPSGIKGIEAAREILPDIPHVAIFDTAFFATLPPEAYLYAIDRELAEKHGIRKYGFHGTSHSYVSKKAAETLGRDYQDLKQIVCHLGNGASISAIHNGVAIETSMGMTPLAGLVMGTRSGDIDPGVHAFLARELNLDAVDIDTMLNRKSGMAGLCGYTDFRDISNQIAAGDEAAKTAFDVYIHRLVSYIGSYYTLLGGADTLVFTAGVGENDDAVRKAVAERLAVLGVALDEAANAVRNKEPRVISTADSAITVMVVPTNEELAMAREIKEVLGI